MPTINCPSAVLRPLTCCNNSSAGGQSEQPSEVKSSINTAEGCAASACVASACAETPAGSKLKSATVANDPKREKRERLIDILTPQDRVKRHGVQLHDSSVNFEAERER